MTHEELVAELERVKASRQHIHEAYQSIYAFLVTKGLRDAFVTWATTGESPRR